MTDTHHAIIKADQRGRLRFTPDQRATLLAAYVLRTDLMSYGFTTLRSGDFG
jgi:hypothetical protein